MDASAVAEYLKQNPAFFEDYADVVAQIFVPHPHGGHAIPIAERQMLALRDKVYDLEQKNEVLHFRYCWLLLAFVAAVAVCHPGGRTARPDAAGPEATR